MVSFTSKNIKEIAEELDCGLCAYFHKKTGHLLFIPDEEALSDIDNEGWESEMEILENNATDYCQIKKWTSNEAFEFMEDFAEQLTENKFLQNKLLEALDKKKPFREFKFVIDNSSDFRDQWFDYKNKRQQEFVENQLNEKLLEE
ncbi:UPF0158 family protein [Pedobacter cryophilus]|uniref:Uncharacterized protein n=1 Tax=Pedobacter cryophilus TaxID=2571271 RepID=A0A4U1BVI0_9SPHI|nr:UPF0158 family protein [Pedobacter cryophilus]TKB96819.1 hypothetical protein FA046_12100 [Pedobacter cryophilus]